jgi:hypothetical protein
MIIQGTNNWVSIPDEKGMFGEPIFLDEKSLLTTNYDQIKSKIKLSTSALNFTTEKAIYTELSKPVNAVFIKPELKTLVDTKAIEFSIIKTK